MCRNSIGRSFHKTKACSSSCCSFVLQYTLDLDNHRNIWCRKKAVVSLIHVEKRISCGRKSITPDGSKASSDASL